MLPKNLLFFLFARSTGYFSSISQRSFFISFVESWVELIICSGNCKYEKRIPTEWRNKNKKLYNLKSSMWVVLLLRIRSVHILLAETKKKALENSFYMYFDYSLEIEFMFIYQKLQHPPLTCSRFIFFVSIALFDAVK